MTLLAFAAERPTPVAAVDRSIYPARTALRIGNENVPKIIINDTIFFS